MHAMCNIFPAVMNKHRLCSSNLYREVKSIITKTKYYRNTKQSLDL